MPDTEDYIVFDRTGTPQVVVAVKTEIGGNCQQSENLDECPIIINDREDKYVMRKFEPVNGSDRKMTITSERRAYIYECAMRNEGPDGTFGDEECLLWEMFRHAYEYGKGERDGIW